MPRFANDDRVREVYKLKKEGLSYRDIGLLMSEKYGQPIWPKDIRYSKNKAIRYKKKYEERYGDNSC